MQSLHTIIQNLHALLGTYSKSGSKSMQVRLEDPRRKSQLLAIAGKTKKSREEAILFLDLSFKD
jgi:hypothetical protein